MRSVFTRNINYASKQVRSSLMQSLAVYIDFDVCQSCDLRIWETGILGSRSLCQGDMTTDLIVGYRIRVETVAGATTGSLIIMCIHSSIKSHGQNEPKEL